MNDHERRDAYQRGPWPNPHRAVAQAYIDTRARDYECDNCGAAIGEFCRRPDELGGGQRKSPCPKRIAAASRALRHHEQQIQEKIDCRREDT